MDSRAVQSHAHEYDEHHYPHSVASKQVAHGEEDHQHDHEKKSVLKKVKAKAKKIKDKVTKHGHHDDHEHGHEYHYEDQHIPDDHELDEEDDEDEEMVEDPEIHGAPTVYDSAAVRSGTPGQVQNIGKPGANFGGTPLMVEPPHHEPRVVVDSPTTQSRVTDPARTFVGEDHGVQRKVNLERPMGLEEDPHAPLSRPGAHAPANYQTKVTDPTGAGGAEIDITPVQKSFTNMTVHNESKPNLEPKILPTITETHYPSAGSHHQFVPDLSTALTHDHNLPQVSSEIKTQYPKSPYAQTHDHNLPQLSIEIKAQYPRSHHDQLMPELPTSTKTQYPYTKSYEQNLPTETHYPSGSHDKFVSGLLYNDPKTHHSHDQDLPQMFSATNTQYPSVGSHDQFVSSATNTQYPSSHHDQDLPQMSTATKTQYPSVGSHDQFISSATNTQYPSVGSHDQFVPESTQTKTHYPSSGNHAQFVPEPIRTSTNRYSENPQPTTTIEEQPQPHYESMDKPSNESSYTDKISSATSAIADKAITANKAVVSKLGYGEKDDKDQNQTRYHEEPSNQSSYTEKISSAGSAIADKAVSAKNIVASKLGYGEKDDRDNKVTTTHEEKKSENTTSAAEHGKNIALSLTEKLAPVYGKVAGVGSAVKSKVPGTERKSHGVMEQDKGVSVKDYLVDKLRPGVEDKALSEMISESLYKKEEEPDEVLNVKNVVSDALHKREEEPERVEGHGPLGKVTESEELKRRLGTDEKTEKWYQERYVNSPGKGVVDKVMDVVGGWFGNTGENQSSQVAGGEDLSKNSGAGVEQVSQAAGGRRLQESSN